MKITPNWDCVYGRFDTKEIKMLCVVNKNHGRVDLCIQEEGISTNFSIASIKLHSKDTRSDFLETLEDAEKLGEEIARRWNECVIIVDYGMRIFPSILLKRKLIRRRYGLICPTKSN